VREGQTSPHKPRLVTSHSTCPPLSPSPHANSFVIGTAVLNNNYSSGGDKGDNNNRGIIYVHIDPTNNTREPQTYVRTAAMYISFINPINKQSRRSRVYTPLVLECTRLLYSGTTHLTLPPKNPPRIYIGYQIPSTTPALLYIGVARTTSAKLRPGLLASCYALLSIVVCQGRSRSLFLSKPLCLPAGEGGHEGREANEVCKKVNDRI
jgi:hypothetical protein